MSEARTRRFRRVARSGYAVYGLIHFLIGGIAIRIAFGDSSVEGADQSGALQQLAGSAIGRILLWAAVIGLVTLGLWQVTRAAGRFNDPKFTTRWGRRIVEGGKGLVYFGLGSTALVFALGGKTSGSEGIRRLSELLLETQSGAYVVAAIGLVTFGTGIGFASIGVRRTFTKLIDLPVGRSRRLVLALGVAGYIAKGVALGTVGVIFVAAAVTGDPRNASGLDGALRSLLELPFGVGLLCLIGFGLILYGFFLIARTRLARL